jgi:hypothetical protein
MVALLLLSRQHTIWMLLLLPLMVLKLVKG